MKKVKKYISFALFFLLIFLFVGCQREEKTQIPPPCGNDGKITILLDAGHGFSDIGCTSPYLEGLHEKDLTLKYVLSLGEKLKALGYTVLYTHDGESFMPNAEILLRADNLKIEYKPENFVDDDIFSAYERTIYSEVLHKELEIDLMLSIHVNANASSNECEGFEIDYCSDKEISAVTAVAFNDICNSLKKAFPKRELKMFADSFEDAFIVTKYNSMPSILFETGFASTPSDAKLLLDPLWQENLTDALRNGIYDYFN